MESPKSVICFVMLQATHRRARPDFSSKTGDCNNRSAMRVILCAVSLQVFLTVPQLASSFIITQKDYGLNQNSRSHQLRLNAVATSATTRSKRVLRELAPSADPKKRMSTPQWLEKQPTRRKSKRSQSTSSTSHIYSGDTLTSDLTTLHNAESTSTDTHMKSSSSTKPTLDPFIDSSSSSSSSPPPLPLTTTKTLHLRYWKSLSSTASKGSGIRKTNIHSQQNNTQVIPTKKASTMPGFMERKKMGRQRSFTDGIRLVQQANQFNPSAIQEIHNMVQDTQLTAMRRKVQSDAMYGASASVPESLIAFTQEIHQEQRITPKEEVELATKTQEAIRLQYLFDTLEETLDRQPTDDEWCAAAGKINMEALRQTMQEGIDAKNDLVTSNLRMVQGVVNVYLRNGLGSQYNAGDLMQEGILALIRAAEKFEPKRGFRFSTYAMYWIRAAIKRAQVGQSRSITIPQRLYENHRKILKVEKDLRQEMGRTPKASEVAQAAGISTTQVQRCLLALAQQCFSLDAQIENTLKPASKGDRKRSTLYDIVQEKPDDHENTHRKQEYLKEELMDTLSRLLTPHEVNLLTLRFGLMNEQTLPLGYSGPLSIAEVSKLVGMKPDKVRRRINSSLRQLRSLIADEWENFEKDMRW